jgi:hypothetical protein
VKGSPQLSHLLRCHPFDKPSLIADHSHLLNRVTAAGSLLSAWLACKHFIPLLPFENQIAKQGMMLSAEPPQELDLMNPTG